MQTRMSKQDLKSYISETGLLVDPHQPVVLPSQCSLELFLSHSSLTSLHIPILL
jgi:hypothetical protein